MVGRQRASAAGELNQLICPEGHGWDWDHGQDGAGGLFYTGGSLLGDGATTSPAPLYDLPGSDAAAVLAEPTPPEADAGKALLLLSAVPRGWPR